MGRQYPVSGSVQGTVGLASDSNVANKIGVIPLVHGTATGTLSGRGRVFWLRSMWAYNVASGLIVALADCSVGATGVCEGGDNVARKLMMTVASCAPANASNMGGDHQGLAKVDFPAPGLKFTTNCCIFLDGTTGNLKGGDTATIGSCGGCGYEA